MGTKTISIREIDTVVNIKTDQLLHLYYISGLEEATGAHMAKNRGTKTITVRETGSSNMEK